MKAIIYAIAILIFGGAIYFTLEHNRKFSELEKVRLETKANNSTVSANADAKEAELQKLNDELADAKQKSEEASTALNLANDDGSKLEREVATLKETDRTQKAELEQIQTELAALEGTIQGLGADISFENLPDKVTELREERDTRAKKLDELETLVDAATKALATKRDEIDRLTRREVSRNSRISRNAMEAVVTAVSQDWGFLVIGAGSNSGFTPETRMLVKRNGQLVGEVTPTAVEPTQTIAEIDFKTLPVGARIQPGDRVLISKPNQN